MKKRRVVVVVVGLSQLEAIDWRLASIDDLQVDVAFVVASVVVVVVDVGAVGDDDDCDDDYDIDRDVASLLASYDLARQSPQTWDRREVGHAHNRASVYHNQSGYFNFHFRLVSIMQFRPCNTGIFQVIYI